METHRQFDLFEPPKELSLGDIMRDAGMRRSLNHANEVTPKWGDRAYNFLKIYLEIHSTPFMAEDVRLASVGFIEEPPSLRAWGSIVVRGSKAGLIRRVGFQNVKNAVAHSTPASVWIRT